MLRNVFSEICELHGNHLRLHAGGFFAKRGCAGGYPQANFLLLIKHLAWLSTRYPQTYAQQFA